MQSRTVLLAAFCASLLWVACSSTTPKPSLDAHADGETFSDLVGDTADPGDEGVRLPEDAAPDQHSIDDQGPDACVPVCSDGAECGDDGCGGNCGTCDEVLFCLESTCVECLGDDDCAIDHSCLENTCVPLGCPTVPCDNGLLCLEDTGECVACLAAADCPPFNACSDHVCVPPPTCESSKDCPDNTVCDKTLGYCFECVTDDDCPEDHRCIETKLCELILYCGSDKECKEHDKVCDLAIGECVDCLSDLDCSDAFYCLGSSCLADVCDQNGAWPACIDGSVAACNTNGSLLEVMEKCPEETYCSEATCHPWLCSPDAAGCAGSVAYVCNQDGSGFAEETDCAEDDEACSGGECKPVVCEPGQPVCLDPLTLVTCSESGTDFVSEPCGDGFFCHDESATCVGWVCVPDVKGCDGETSLTCDQFGTAWGSPVECNADGLFCEDGECVACDPACGNRECGPDACGGTCGTCEAPTSCLAGYCEDQTCPTPCNGKSIEAFLCGIDVCYPDLVGATELAAPQGDPFDQMFNVQAKYGDDGNDLVPNNAPSFAIMATGKIANTQHNDEMAPNQCGADPIKQGNSCDAITGTLNLTAPAGATGFSIDFVFLTKEVEVQQPFDDRFYILMNAPVTTNGQTWVINFMKCLPNVEPDFAVEGVSYCYIRALSGFAVNPSPLNLAGTAFVGSTAWLRTSWEVAPGEQFSLTFRIADWQDGKYDSAAVIDNFNWIFTPVTPKTEPLP